MNMTNIEVAGLNLLPADQGEIVHCRAVGNDEIVGVAVMMESVEGTPFPAFVTSAKGWILPIIVMTIDDPIFRFERTGETVETFALNRNRAEYMDFFAKLCEHNGWQHDQSAALNYAHYMSRRDDFGEITDVNIVEASEIAREVREHFYGFLRAIEIRSDEQRA